MACAAAWRVVDNQSGSWNNFLGGVAAVSPTDIWAVGNSQDATTANDQNLIEHWDGTAWSLVPTPNPTPGANDLNDVAAVASNDVWAVGASNASGIDQPTSLHWDGTAWTSVFTPAVQGQPTVLNDVSAIDTSHVWAVGEQYIPAYNIWNPLAELWIGPGWTIPPGTREGVGDNFLYGVAARAPTDVWAVGYFRQWLYQPSPRQVLIEHFDGNAWTVAASDPMPLDSTLLSVAATASNDAWAVGYTDLGNGNTSLLTLHWNGTKWTQVPSGNASSGVNKLGDVVAIAANNYYAVGYAGPGIGSVTPVIDHWDGTTWTASFGAATGVQSRLFSLAVAGAGDLWAVGTYLTSANVYKNLVENYSGLAVPTGVTATATDQSATVSWTLPCSDGGSPITSYVVTAYDGCTIQGSASVVGTPPATTTTFTGLSNGTAFTFTVAAVNAFGLGPQSAASSVVTPTGTTKPTWVTACSPQQYALTGNDGSTWVDMDASKLNVSFTPTVDSFAIVSGNADLWTSNAGYNQDVGIAMTGGIYPTAVGRPEAWKESGGFAGTFSPNAAYVQRAIPVKAATAYTARLQWKANKADAGSIFVGAGPIGNAFSPTRLTVQLIPTSAAIVFSATSTAQYSLTGNDGNTWVDMDPTNLKITFTWPSTGYTWGLVSANADLWTSSAGYNQDVGVAMTGGHYPSGSWLPEVWGESGGYGGTFSPNAAFVQGGVNDTLLSGTAGGTEFSARLQWKANKGDPGTIYAGAGPIGGHFSPTTLTVVLIPDNSFAYQETSWQYTQPNSDGSYWQEMDSNHQLTQGLGGPGTWSVSANANLWTSVAGYNQDVGIMVSGGAYGSGTVVAWKESGGFAGTFSPNAAFLSVVLQLQAGSSYSWWVVWKANRPAQVANSIFEGAGGGSNISQIWLTSVRLS